MRTLLKIFGAYGFASIADFAQSLAPSFKYHLGAISIGLSMITATIELILGVKTYTASAFAILAAAELATGIYASVVVKREKLESHKMSRFIIKLALVLICLFVLKAFEVEFKERSVLISQLFGWMRDGVFTFSAFEYLISVLENISIITGKPNNLLIDSIKSRLNKLFGAQ